MAKKQNSNKAVQAPKVLPNLTNRGVKPTIGYTLRTVQRSTWNRFTERLAKEGRTVNWALNQFIEQYGNNDDKIILSVD